MEFPTIEILVGAAIASQVIFLLVWVRKREDDESAQLKLSERLDELATFGGSTRRTVERLRNTFKRHENGAKSHWRRFKEAKEDAEEADALLRKEAGLKEKKRTYRFGANSDMFKFLHTQNPRPWTPAEEFQATSRLYRQGTKTFLRHFDPEQEVAAWSSIDIDYAEIEKKVAAEIIAAMAPNIAKSRYGKHIYMGVDLAREGSEDQSIWAYSNPDTGKLHVIPDGDFEKFFKDLQDREAAAKVAKDTVAALKETKAKEDLADKCKDCGYFERNQCEGSKSVETVKDADADKAERELLKAVERGLDEAGYVKAEFPLPDEEVYVVKEFTIAEVLRKLQETNEKLDKLAKSEPSSPSEEVSRDTKTAAVSCDTCIYTNECPKLRASHPSPHPGCDIYSAAPPSVYGTKAWAMEQEGQLWHDSRGFGNHAYIVSPLHFSSELDWSASMYDTGWRLYEDRPAMKKSAEESAK